MIDDNSTNITDGTRHYR